MSFACQTNISTKRTKIPGVEGSNHFVSKNTYECVQDDHGEFTSMKACEENCNANVCFDKDYECKLCTQVITIACRLECGHTFCKMCLDAQGPGAVCKTCKKATKMDNVHMDLKHDRVVVMCSPELYLKSMQKAILPLNKGAHFLEFRLSKYLTQITANLVSVQFPLNILDEYAKVNKTNNDFVEMVLSVGNSQMFSLFNRVQTDGRKSFWLPFWYFSIYCVRSPTAIKSDVEILISSMTHWLNRPFSEKSQLGYFPGHDHLLLFGIHKDCVETVLEFIRKYAGKTGLNRTIDNTCIKNSLDSSIRTTTNIQNQKKARTTLLTAIPHYLIPQEALDVATTKQDTQALLDFSAHNLRIRNQYSNVVKTE
jgi:hypothetical protein